MTVKKTNGFARLRRMADSLRITRGDLAGPVLVRLGQVHRQQMTRIFASEGREGGAGRWPSLNPSYEARKRKLVGRRKTLVLTGGTKTRFTSPTNPNYIQDYVGGESGGVYQFGASSEVAAAHFFGDPSAALLQSATAARAFGGVAPRLPVRDMITKTSQQVAAFRERFVRWYAEERVPQVLRAAGKR